MSRNHWKADPAPVAFAALKRTVLDGGFEAATIRTIAEEAGTSTGALRNRWGHKSVLIEAACWAVQADLARAVLRRASARPRRDPAKPAPTRHQELVEYLAASLPFDAQSRDDTTIWLAFKVRARSLEDVRRAVLELDARWLDQCRKAVAYLGIVDVEPEALRLHLLMEGLRARLCDRDGFGVDAAVAALDHHLRSLAAVDTPALSPGVNER